MARATISNTNKSIVLGFKNTWGGSITTSANNSRPNCKIIHQWIVQARDAEHFLKQILPHLSIKRKASKAFLEFRATFGKPGGRISDRSIIKKRLKLIEQVHALNRRGQEPHSP